MLRIHLFRKKWKTHVTSRSLYNPFSVTQLTQTLLINPGFVDEDVFQFACKFLGFDFALEILPCQHTLLWVLDVVFLLIINDSLSLDCILRCFHDSTCFRFPSNTFNCSSQFPKFFWPLSIIIFVKVSLPIFSVFSVKGWMQCNNQYKPIKDSENNNW